MATKHHLSAQPRQILGRKVKLLRRQGLIPANVFSKNAPSVNVQVNARDFAKTYAVVGESVLLYLQVDGETAARPVLVRDVTVHPVSGDTLHIDFNQVSLKEKVTAPVPVKLVGDAPAEQEKLGILVQQLDEVEIEALPTDMPESLEVSVAELRGVGDAILVKDIPVSGLTIKTDPDSIVVKIEALAAEEPVEAPPIVAGEGEVPAEGATTAEGAAATEPATTEPEKTE